AEIGIRDRNVTGVQTCALPICTQLKSQLDLASVNVSCGYDASLTKNGLHPKVSWTFNSANDPLSQKASYFLCDSIKLEHTQKLEIGRASCRERAEVLAVAASEK